MPEQLCVKYLSFCRSCSPPYCSHHVQHFLLPLLLFLGFFFGMETLITNSKVSNLDWFFNLCTRVCHCVKNPTLDLRCLHPLRTTAMCRCLLGTLSLSCYTENQNFGWTASVEAASFPNPSMHTHFNSLGTRLEQQACSMQGKWRYFENSGHLQQQCSILLCLCP